MTTMILGRSYTRDDAIQFLRLRVDGDWLGRDPYDDGIVLLEVDPGVSPVSVHSVERGRAMLDLAGLVLDERRHGQFVRIRAILEADVWEQLGDVPSFDDEPLASRKVVRR